MKTTPYQEGDPSSKILFIGEAPSHKEMQIGRPFVGPAGALLNDCLHAASILRSDCYFLNVFERPVKKKIQGQATLILDENGEILWHSKSGLSEYGKTQQISFVSAMQEASPNLICPLGATALSCIYPDWRIMRLRGSILKSPVGKIIPTLHPAGVLRGQYSYRHVLASDLRKVALNQNFADYRLIPRRKLITRPTYVESMDFLERAQKKHTISFDIECYHQQVSCISFCWNSLECISIPFLNAQAKPYWEKAHERHLWETIRKLLGNPSIAKVGYNHVAFDNWFLERYHGIEVKGPQCDAMVAQSIMWPFWPKGLEFSSSLHTWEPYYKDDRKLWNQLDVDIEAFWRYNAKDSAVTLECWNELEPLLEAGGYTETYELTSSLGPAICYMQSRGIQVDHDKLENMGEKLGEEIDRMQFDLDELVGEHLNVASHKQMCTYFYDTLKRTPYRHRGKPSCNDKALSQIVRSNGKGAWEAKLAQEIRNLRKLKSTYVEMKFDSDGRFRTSFNIRGTWPGRLSSSKTIHDTGGNAQNLDPRVKEVFLADD